jgi:hypothetical protein
MFDAVGRSVIPHDPSMDVAPVLAAMNTGRVRSVIACLNPSITFTVGDVERVPIFSRLIRDSGGPPTSTWTAGDVA